jgi:hypothetical protein
MNQKPKTHNKIIFDSATLEIKAHVNLKIRGNSEYEKNCFTQAEYYKTHMESLVEEYNAKLRTLVKRLSRKYKVELEIYP